MPYGGAQRRRAALRHQLAQREQQSGPQERLLSRVRSWLPSPALLLMPVQARLPKPERLVKGSELGSRLGEGWVVVVLLVVVVVVVMVLAVVVMVLVVAVVVVLGQVLGRGRVLGREQEVGWALVATLLTALTRQSPKGSRRGPPHSQSLQQQRRHGLSTSSA